jgi:hypothetical protein
MPKEQKLEYGDKLELRLWPLTSGYHIEVKNTDFLKEKMYPVGELPTRVLTYTEQPGMLKDVKHQTVDMLDSVRDYEIKVMNSAHNSDIPMRLLAWGTTSMVTGLGASKLSEEPVVKGLLAAGGVGLMTLCNGYIWWERRKEFKNNVKNLRENVKSFNATPYDTFEMVKDEEMADIADAIVSGGPIKFTKPKPSGGRLERYMDNLRRREEYDNIKDMVDNMGSLSTFPTDVYKQKLATYSFKK